MMMLNKIKVFVKEIGFLTREISCSPLQQFHLSETKTNSGIGWEHFQKADHFCKQLILKRFYQMSPSIKSFLNQYVVIKE